MRFVHNFCEKPKTFTLNRHKAARMSRKNRHTHEFIKPSVINAKCFLLAIQNLAFIVTGNFKKLRNQTLPQIARRPTRGSLKYAVPLVRGNVLFYGRSHLFQIGHNQNWSPTHAFDGGHFFFAGVRIRVFFGFYAFSYSVFNFGTGVFCNTYHPLKTEAAQAC